MAFRQLPDCESFIVCDYVHQDAASRKCSTIGNFLAIGCTSFPTTVRFGLYICLRNISGKGKVDIVLERADSVLKGDGAQPLGSVNCEVHTEAGYQEFAINLPGVTFHEPSEYVFVVTADDQFVCEKRFVVSYMPKG